MGVATKQRPLRSILFALLSFVLLLAAIGVIANEMRHMGFEALRSSLAHIPSERWLASTLLTPLAYGLLTGYDLLAFHSIRRRLPLRRIVFTAFLGYAYSNSISMAPSIAVRYRLYSLWGVARPDREHTIQSEITYLGFLSVLVLAQIAQIPSHVPGGVGVFENVMLLLLKPYAPSASILAALLVYRFVFMLIPLAAASGLLAVFEFRERRRAA